MYLCEARRASWSGDGRPPTEILECSREKGGDETYNTSVPRKK